MGDVSKGFLAKRTPKYSFLGGVKPIFFQEKIWVLLRLLNLIFFLTRKIAL
jgi:hypothetical protein